MRPEALGNSTSEVEVTNISSHGIWLLTGQKELFMPYHEFPWFKESPIKHILHVIEHSPGHFYWPDLDVDLSVQIIENPQHYPLKAK